MSKLSLSYNTEFQRFVLRERYQRDPDGCASYEMVIDYDGVDSSYRFLIWEEGEWSECITKTDLKQRIQDVRDHEGDEVAAIWEQEHTYYVLRDDHPVWKLQAKWEAMMELDLFDIPPAWHAWHGKPLSDEAIVAMNAARDREMQRCADEMAEAIEAHKQAAFDKNVRDYGPPEGGI